MLIVPFNLTYVRQKLDNESYVIITSQDPDYIGQSDEVLHDLFCQYQHKGRSASDFIEEVIITGLSMVKEENVTRHSVWQAYKEN